MARNLIASDETGLSDPFARILIRDHIGKTTIVKETLNPIWDETVIFEEITFYATVEMIKANPPPIVVEIFDWDDEVIFKQISSSIDIYFATKLHLILIF